MPVVPFVQDTKNALVMRFEPVPDLAVLAGLQSAFKEAILRQFQLEPRELSCESMPSPKDRKEILFYEASEGGAGVLRQVVEDPQVIPALARRALEICHFDPDTLADREAANCGRACYSCLLDYFNQPDHPLLDRHLIRDILAGLARSECHCAGGAGSRAERLQELKRRCDSQLEQSWLDRLDQLALSLPSDAQPLIENCSVRPDFLYRDKAAAIFIDGPVHDQPQQIREDDAVNERLMNANYLVIRFHHRADWNAIFREYPDVFEASHP